MGFLFNRNQMTPEEQAIHNEVKSNFRLFNDNYDMFERWLNRINMNESTYKKVLSLSELDQIILEKTQLDKVITALDIEYRNLITKAHPFILFNQKLSEKSIKFNNLNFDEKKLIKEPLKNNLNLLSEWNKMKDEFDSKIGEVYKSVIVYFDDADISNLRIYSLKRMNFQLENIDDIITKVSYVDKVFAYAVILIKLCETKLVNVFNSNGEIISEFDKLLEVLEIVNTKFPFEKGENSIFSSVDKKFKSAKKMFYYLHILDDLPNCLDMFHQKCIEGFYEYISTEEIDNSNKLKSFNISLSEAIALIGVSPEFALKKVEVSEASYGGRKITIKKLMIGRSLFTEVNDVLTSIEFNEEYEMDLEEELAAETIGYKY